ncbi:MAG: hypothetical protein JWP89_2339 [Schlesneria sp.]|nr:hypothetical protein [Schlesneria sp.]
MTQWPAISAKISVSPRSCSSTKAGAAFSVAPGDVDLENQVVMLSSETAKTWTEQGIISVTTTGAIAKLLDLNRDQV